MRTAFLGPAGTFSHEALRAAGAAADELVALPTVHDTVLAVQRGEAERALVPVENSQEGIVTATVDVLALEATEVQITGELVHPIRHQLVAAAPLALAAVTEVISHPQPLAQCAGFLRERVPGAALTAARSSAEAVAIAVERGGTSAAIGTRLAAELRGATVLAAGIEDDPANSTRFVWLARARSGSGAAPAAGPLKTTVVFWGAGDAEPGWLVACLSAFASRGLNLSLIQSRPRRGALGHHFFFIDVEAGAQDPRAGEAIAELAGRAETVRVLGSYPAAAPG